MFGSRRNKDKQPLDWPSLLSLLEDDDRRAAIDVAFPTEGRDSFLNTLRRLQPRVANDVLASGRQLHTAEKLVDWPTVAIAGMLNSGKTSLVATFLSEAGRARTLRGTNNAQGTHRFVLWLPNAWRRDVELWGLLMSRIGDAVGHAPEMLAEDPADAHAQYNNRAGDEVSLSVPLVATDVQLDSVGIGLLDCPDIVSDEAFGLGSPQARRELLGRAATLCSAFLVVSSAESSRDGTLGDLLRIASDLMPGVPRLLAVNKVRARQTPDQVYETFQPVARSNGIETIYAAYDFDVPSSGPYIPGADSSLGVDFDPNADPLPVFFSLSQDPDDNPPAAISGDRLLSTLPAKLDRGQLFEKFCIALQSSLRSVIWETAFGSIQRDADASQVATQKARECLLEASLDFFAHREIGGQVTELRLHQSERILRQLSESFAATAPWYARWGVRLNTRVRRVFGGASDFLKQLTPSAIAQRTAGEIKDKFRSGEYGGLMTPQRLAQSIGRHGGVTSLAHWAGSSGAGSSGTAASRTAASGVGAAEAGAERLSGTETTGYGSIGSGEIDSNGIDSGAIGSGAIDSSEIDAGEWHEACEAAILRFERDDFTALDPRRLDDAVREMWSEVPTHKKLAAGLTPLAAMLATFGGVLMIPIDFGTTQMIASASIPELFAAAGLTTLSTLWAGGQSTRNVGQQAARQQLADFHAVLCDTFGIARMTEPVAIEVNGVHEKVVPSKIVVRDAIGKSLPLYRVRDEFQKELQRIVTRSGPTNS